LYHGEPEAEAKFGNAACGLRKDGKPINEWPQRCAKWMKSPGFLNAN
jgi:hypothetical protein